jgi:hypothetical protein
MAPLYHNIHNTYTVEDPRSGHLYKLGVNVFRIHRCLYILEISPPPPILLSGSGKNEKEEGQKEKKGRKIEKDYLVVKN